MGKFSGIIGYARQVETSPGVWKDVVIEKRCRGDILENKTEYISLDKVNEDVALDNSISIVANEYAYRNIGAMRYICINGYAWRIRAFSIKRPRILLQIGGVYNGERPPISP